MTEWARERHSRPVEWPMLGAQRAPLRICVPRRQGVPSRTGPSHACALTSLGRSDRIGDGHQRWGTRTKRASRCAIFFGRFSFGGSICARGAARLEVRATRARTAERTAVAAFRYAAAFTGGTIAGSLAPSRRARDAALGWAPSAAAGKRAARDLAFIAPRGTGR